MATFYVFTWILSIQSTLSVITSENTNNNEVIGPITIEQAQSEGLVSPPCIMAACVNPCGEFESWIGGTLETRPHCLGYPNTRCQGYAECNRGCYARYFNTITGDEIFNCIIVHPQTPQPTTPTPTAPSPITPSPDPQPQPQPQPVPWPDTIPAPSPYCVAQNLPSPGHRCNSMEPTSNRCCQPGGPGSARCKYSGINFKGEALGSCCIRNNMDGCTQDSHCCDNEYICSYGICLKPLSGPSSSTPLSINANPDPNSNPDPSTNTASNPAPNTNTNANPSTNTVINTNAVSGTVLQPIEAPPVTLSDLEALGIGKRSIAPQVQGGSVNANPEPAVAADSLPLDIIRPESITDDHKHNNNGYGKYMSVGLTTGTMIWVSFVLLWLSLCSILYWFRKRPETYIDSIVDETIITSDTYDDHMLEIATPKLGPMPTPAEIDDL